MPVFTDGRLRPRLDAVADGPAGGGPRARLPGRDRRGPARPDRARRATTATTAARSASPAARPRPTMPTPAATALREANEEVGLDARRRGRPGRRPARRGLHPGQRLPDHAGPRRRRAARRRSSANPAEVARILTPPVARVPAGRPDRDRRADDRRLAAPLRRLPDRRASTSGARRPGSSASSGAVLGARRRLVRLAARRVAERLRAGRPREVALAALTTGASPRPERDATRRPRGAADRSASSGPASSTTNARMWP